MVNKTKKVDKIKFAEYVGYALKTWYPLDHEFRFSSFPSLGKLVGELGELLDDTMKSKYKPGFSKGLLDEMSDVWFYLRICCYQQNHTPIVLDSCFGIMPQDKLLAIAIKEVSTAYIDYYDYGYYPTFCLDFCFSVLLELLDRGNTTIDELTKISWDKIKPGTAKYKEWERK